jgi:16S rRNA (guanine527-N7)-methyltransferase
MFKDNLATLDFNLQETQIKQLNHFCNLLMKWNNVYNLTAITEPADIINKHILDSLLITKYITFTAKSWLDVGAGGGIPGLILAIYYPDITFTLLDSNGKKTRFMKQATLELKLKNVTIVQNRIESFQTEPFDIISSRAFARLQLFLDLTQHLSNQQTHFVALKGANVEAELQEIANFQILNNYHYFLPNQDERSLVILKRGL